MISNTPLAIEAALFVDINGQQQWITIRGQERDNPVLFIVNGPGVALSPWALFFQPWEKYFTLVQWDQPGAGATYGTHGETGMGPYTLNRITRDAIAVARFVCRYLNVDKVIFSGISAGTVIGLMAIQHYPELFSAYTGCGQFVHWLRQARRSYELVLQQARDGHDHAAVRELEQIGPPPYAGIEAEVIKSKYAGAMTPAEQTAMAKLDPEVLAAMLTPPADANYIAREVEYARDPMALATRMFDRLRPEFYAFDAWQLGRKFEVPMIFIQGELDFYSVTSEVEKYITEIEAPRKRLDIFAGAGHGAIFMRDELLDRLVANLKIVQA